MMNMTEIQKNLRAVEAHCQRLLGRLQHSGYLTGTPVSCEWLLENVGILHKAQTCMVDATNIINEARAAETRVILNDDNGLPI